MQQIDNDGHHDEVCAALINKCYNEMQHDGHSEVQYEAALVGAV